MEYLVYYIRRIFRNRSDSYLILLEIVSNDRNVIW